MREDRRKHATILTARARGLVRTAMADRRNRLDYQVRARWW